MRETFVLCAILAITPLCAKSKKHVAQPATSLDRYLAALESQNRVQQSASPGSLFSPTAGLADPTRDMQAGRVNDIVTILVSDRASAVSTGATNTSRKSSAKGGITALGGALSATAALPNMASMTGDQQLQGQGTTSRTSALSTTVSARVTHVLPNGNLVVQGEKSIWVNSENQAVVVRGIIRPSDIGGGNVVASDRLSDLEIRINGKGVVGDSVRRPNFLYRLLLGLLPF